MQTYLRTGIALLLAAGCGGTSAGAIPDAGVGPAQSGGSGGGATTSPTSLPDASDTFFPEASTGQGSANGTGVPADAAAAPWAFSYAGSVMGLQFHPKDGTGFVNTTPSGAKASAGVKTELYVVFSDATNLCATGINHQGAAVFSLDLLSGDATPQPGTFTATQQQAPGQANIRVAQLSASCGAEGLELGSASGTVVLTSVSASVVSGTFSVDLLQDAGTLSGSFSVPVCGQAPNTSCQP
jgi:hypothetical protein